MSEKTIAFEAGNILFQLNNSAAESGFSQTESWEVELADEEGMKRVIKNYSPAVAGPIAQNILLEVFKTIKGKLNQNIEEKIALLDKKAIENQGLAYIVAYNLKREIR